MRRLEYFHQPLHLGHGVGSNDPFSPEYLEPELRGELDKARWWAQQEERKQAQAALAMAEMSPGMHPPTRSVG